MQSCFVILNINRWGKFFSLGPCSYYDSLELYIRGAGYAGYNDKKIGSFEGDYSLNPSGAMGLRFFFLPNFGAYAESEIIKRWFDHRGPGKITQPMWFHDHSLGASFRAKWFLPTFMSFNGNLGGFWAIPFKNFVYSMDDVGTLEVRSKSYYGVLVRVGTDFDVSKSVSMAFDFTAKIPITGSLETAATGYSLSEGAGRFYDFGFGLSISYSPI